VLLVTAPPTAVAAGGGAGVNAGAAPAGQPGNVANAGASGGAGTSGGAAPTLAAPAPSTPSHPTVPGYVARLIKGIAYAPAYAPVQVQRAIWAGNRLRNKPYAYGGGHGKFSDTGYDCSGTVSYVLHAAGLLRTPLDSSDFMNWGDTGVGQWITVYTNPDHAFVVIAGLRLDTSAAGDVTHQSGPRYRSLLRDVSGYTARHPTYF
jgi:cell wall-associated NlpC family hydrolase